LIIATPRVPFSTSPEPVKIKVTGQRGNTLRVQVFGILWVDYLTNTASNIFAAYLRQVLGNKVFESTYSINADPYEVEVWWRTYSPPWMEVAVMSITVEDAQGNVLEGLTLTLAYDARGSTITVNDRTEVWYILAVTGQILHLVLYPGQYYVLPNHEAFLTIVWRRGYIALYRGKTKVFEASGGSAIFTLQFKLDKDMAMLMGSYIERHDIAQIVYKAPELAPWIGIVDYFRHVLQSTRLTVIGVDASYDGYYYYVNVSVQADLMSPIDLQNILKIIAGIVAIIVGGFIVAKSLGVATPIAIKLIALGIGAVLAGGGLYTVITTPSTENPTGTQKAAELITEEAIKKLEALKQTMKQVFTQLYQQGKISQDDYNKLTEYVEKEITDVQKYVQTLNKMVATAYEQGKASMYPWIVVSFVGGILGGMILERAAMPRIAPG
jgi:hypothetical protein